MDLYYLKPTIKAKPLTWRWYAWLYMNPPLTSTPNTAEHYLEIMQPYVQKYD